MLGDMLALAHSVCILALSRSADLYVRASCKAHVWCPCLIPRSGHRLRGNQLCRPHTRYNTPWGSLRGGPQCRLFMNEKHVAGVAKRRRRCSISNESTHEYGLGRWRHLQHRLNTNTRHWEPVENPRMCNWCEAETSDFPSQSIDAQRQQVCPLSPPPPLYS